MSKGRNWTKDRRKHQGSESQEVYREEQFMTGRVAFQHRQQADIEWIMRVLETPGLIPTHKDKLERSLLWLKSASGRTLGPTGNKTGWRAYYLRIWQAICSGAYFEIADEETKRASYRKNLRMSVCRLARREELKQRSGWESDPSLLPKKPPKAQEAE